MHSLRDAARALRHLLGTRPAAPHLQAPEPTGRLLGVLHRNDGHVRVVWNTSRGRPVLTFRLWKLGSGDWLPARAAGFSVRMSELPDLVEAIAAAVEEAERWAREGRGQ